MTDEDRRGWERRLDTLEKNYLVLTHGLQRVEIEQGHVQAMMRSNFTAIETGQRLIETKIDGFLQTLNRLAGSPEETPAGKALLREIQILTERLVIKDREIADLTDTCETLVAAKNHALGAIWLAGSSLFVAVVGILKAFAWWPGSGAPHP